MEALATFFAVVAGTVVTAAVIFFSLARRNRWRDTLSYLADSYGLRFSPGTFFKGSVAEGSVGEFGLKFDSYTVSTGKSSQVYTRVVVSTGLPKGLSLKKEGLFSGFKKVFTGSDVEVGIDDFDDAFLIDGARESAVLSRLGARSRAAIWNAIGATGATLKDGQIRWTTSGLVTDTARLRGVADALLELATALSDHAGSNADCLARHVGTDPDVAFRRTCLEALMRDLPNAPQTAAALREATRDADVGLRFLAAKSLGAEGLEVIRALLREGGLPEDMRREAAALLGPSYGGGLALSPEGDAGGLSLQSGAGEGALSEAAEATPAARRRRQKQ